MFEQDIAISPYNFKRGIVDRGSIPKKITVYDSTLRDGEQMPGVSFKKSEKIVSYRNTNRERA